MEVTEAAPPLAVSVVGLGKLGASMAASFAAAGARVIGTDVNPDAVARVAAGQAPVAETGLAELIAASAVRLDATMDTAAAAAATDITFVIVPTPSEPDGSFSIGHARDAFREIGRGLAGKSAWHTVVLTSTVLPGAMRFGLIPLLEEASGKRCGIDFGVCYSPAFIALGSVIRNFTHPDMVLIGESDPRAGVALEAAYRRVMKNDPPYCHMSLENAELTKVALNTFVTMKISFANMLAALCEQLPGGDVDVVTAALGRDRRVGSHYLKGGTAYGGPCFPRDNRALASLASAVGVELPLAESTDRVNRATVQRLGEAAFAHLRPGMTALVLGLAYKTDTWVIEESAGAAVAVALARRGVRVLGWDPNVTALPQQLEGVELAGSIAEGAAAADVVLVTLPDPAYLALAPALSAGRTRPVVVLDAWRLLRDALADVPNVSYVATGLGADEATAAERLAMRWSGAAPVTAVATMEPFKGA